MSALRDGLLAMLRTGPKTNKELGILVDRKVSSVKREVWAMMKDKLVERTGTKGHEVAYGLTEAGVKAIPLREISGQ